MTIVLNYAEMINGSSSKAILDEHTMLAKC